MTLAARSRVWLLAAAAIAAVGTCLVYSIAIDSGFYYDDYHFVRPWSALELRRVWFGSWDPSGIESIFFRPLTAWLFAARFWLFGLNAPTLHALSLVGHALCAVLLAWFVRRENAPTPVALFAAWLYAIHPLMPYAQVSWLTNQMHLVESLLVLSAMLYWQFARRRSAIWLAPLGILAVIVFLIKEDGVMLGPVLLVMTLIHPSSRRQWSWRTAIGITSAVAIAALSLIAFRYLRLGRLGGYGTPTVDAAYSNLWKGLNAAITLWPTRTPWQAVASVIGIAACVAGVGIAWRSGVSRLAHRLIVVGALGLIIVLALNVPALFYERPYPLITAQALASGSIIAMLVIGGGVATWRSDTRALVIMGIGLAVVIGFNLPFVLVSKREQYHLLAAGAVILCTGAVDAVMTSSRKRAWFALTLCVLISLPLVFLARQQARAFLPCGDLVLEGDHALAGWWPVPPEITTWAESKARECQAGGPLTRLGDLPMISWNTYEPHEDEKGTYRWTSDHGVLMVNRSAALMTLALRRPDAARDRAVRVEIAGDFPSTVVVLDSADWTFATVRFRRSPLAWLRDGHRVDLITDRWYVPAAADPRASDLRRFGVEFMVVAIN